MYHPSNEILQVMTLSARVNPALKPSLAFVRAVAAALAVTKRNDGERQLALTAVDASAEAVSARPLVSKAFRAARVSGSGRPSAKDCGGHALRAAMLVTNETFREDPKGGLSLAKAHPRAFVVAIVAFAQAKAGLEGVDPTIQERLIRYSELAEGLEGAEKALLRFQRHSETKEEVSDENEAILAEEVMACQSELEKFEKDNQFTSVARILDCPFT